MPFFVTGAAPKIIRSRAVDRGSTFAFAPGSAGSPPVRGLSPRLQGIDPVRRLLPRAASQFAVLPEFVRAPLVPEDEIVEFKLVDRTGVEIGKAVSHALEQSPQFPLVVGNDPLAT